MKNLFLCRKAGLSVAGIAIMADFFSKNWILDNIHQLPLTLIPNLFEFTFAWNRGVSFSFLANSREVFDIFGHQIGPDLYLPIGLTAVAVAASAYFFHWMGQEKRITSQIALGLMIGGALGNAYDRMAYGAVVDFLHVFYQGWHFPAFNIADCAISVGVGLLFLDSFVHYVRTKKKG